MKKKAAVFMTAIAAAALAAGNVQAAEEPAGELYVFFAASLSNAMEDIQKNFNETYPDVEILYRLRSKRDPDVMFSFPPQRNRWTS